MFKRLVKELNLGNLISNPSRVYGGLTHKMYMIETDKGKYVVKILNKEIMKRSTALDNFARSEKFEKVLEQNNIPCIYASEFNGKKMQQLDGDYFYVFDYFDGKSLKDNEITINHVQKIGEVLSKIHNIEIKGDNTIPTKDIDFKKLIDLSKDSEIYEDIYDKLDILNESMIKGNEAISKVPVISTICHNDMDLKNVLWNNDKFRIIDLECLCYSNPYLELFETALCWSGYEECNVNFDLFREFIHSYIKNTKIDMNIDWEQIYYLNNERLKWLEFNIKRVLNTDEKELGISEVIKTIKHVMYYNSIKDKILEVINEIIKE